MPDLKALAKEAKQGAEMGFSGKQIIHPDQIETTQAAFTPNDEEIAQARKIIEAHTEHQERGSGAFAMDGKMVDMPIVRAAQRVLVRAQTAWK